MKQTSAAATSGDLKRSPLKPHFRQFLDSLLMNGINADIAKQARLSCEQIIDKIQEKPTIEVAFSDLLFTDASLVEHSWLTGYFTAVIIQNISWSSPRTNELAVFGAILHDLGISQLPEEISGKSPEEYTEEEIALYKTHPQLAADLFRRWHLPEPVAQIALQHHECIDGSGYPFGTVYKQIYPLAKIVALANSFSEFVLTEKLPVVQCLKLYASNPKVLEQFDGDSIRALIKGFIKGK